MDITTLLQKHPIDMKNYESLYKHFHQNPELSNLEIETSRKIISELSRFPEFTIKSSIGGHGLVGIFINGPGKTIMLRADMDALPILEATGLPYSSTTTTLSPSGSPTPVMHACGHDMHITCLLAASEILVKAKENWRGTLIVLFQPAEERGTGAKAMVDDGLYDDNRHAVPVPDLVLGQHVMAFKAGCVGTRMGTLMAGADSLKVKVFGKGGHGSQPHLTIDPAVLASHIVLRLQTLISREISPTDISVLTIGSLSAGHTENIISSTAELGIDIRSILPSTRTHLLSSIRRIVNAECVASNCPFPALFTITRHLPNTVNDEKMMNVLNKTFEVHFGDSFDRDISVTTISEDFSVLATSVGRPCVFWHFGSVEGERWDRAVREAKEGEIPANHTAGFAPVVQPTLRTGIEALVVAALGSFDVRVGARL